MTHEMKDVARIVYIYTHTHTYKVTCCTVLAILAKYRKCTRLFDRVCVWTNEQTLIDLAIGLIACLRCTIGNNTQSNSSRKLCVFVCVCRSLLESSRGILCHRRDSVQGQLGQCLLHLWYEFFDDVMDTFGLLCLCLAMANHWYISMLFLYARACVCVCFAGFGVEAVCMKYAILWLISDIYIHNMYRYIHIYAVLVSMLWLITDITVSCEPFAKIVFNSQFWKQNQLDISIK